MVPGSIIIAKSWDNQISFNGKLFYKEKRIVGPLSNPVSDFSNTHTFTMHRALH